MTRMFALAPVALLPLTPQVTATLDQILAGVTTTLPANVITVPTTVDGVVPGGVVPGGVVPGGVVPGGVLPGGDPLAGATGAPGTTGATGAARAAGGGTAAGAPGAAGSLPAATPGDVRAPAASVQVLSNARRAAKTGRLRVTVRTDEASVVALAAAIRPGAKARGVRARGRHWRGVIHTAPVVHVLSVAGEHTVVLKLPARHRRHLGAARDARVSVALLVADAARNQAGLRVKSVMRR